jgi:hypothetical protein
MTAPVYKIRVNKTYSGMWFVRSHPPGPQGHHVYATCATWDEALARVRSVLKVWGR